MPYLVLAYATGEGAPLGGGSTTPDCTAPHFLDNTYWTDNTNMTWDGTKWTIIDPGDSPNWRLDTTGSWAVGFRPTSMTIKIYKPSGGITFDSWDLRVYDTANQPISSLVDLGSGYSFDTVHTVNIPLTFGANDISYMRGDDFLYNDGPQIRCINFTV